MIAASALRIAITGPMLARTRPASPNYARAVIEEIAAIQLFCLCLMWPGFDWVGSDKLFPVTCT